MSLDGHDRAIKALNRTHEQASEAMKTKALGIHSPRSRCDQAGELPAQEDPGVDQHQADSQEEEAQGRIARSGASSGLTHGAVTALNAKTAPITLVDLVRRPVETNNDEGQPFAAAFAGLARHQAGHQSQVGGCAVLEGVNCPVALATPAQSPSAALFASNRARDDRRLSADGQITNDRPGGEGLVQI